MSTTHEAMMKLTAHMAMKTIEINGEPYLQRYMAQELADGTQVWYHRFLRNDAERHLHTHPWASRSTILVGWYCEEKFVDGRRGRWSYGVDSINHINAMTTHRIVEVGPDTWTQMIVLPEREPTWSFINDDGTTEVMISSPVDWYKDCDARACA